MGLRRKGGEGFEGITGPSNYNQQVEVLAIVSGKSMAPYFVPKDVKITCQSGEDCAGCAYPKPAVEEIVPEDEKLLYFVDAKSSQISFLLRLIFKIRCAKFSYDILEVRSIERVFINQVPGKDRVRDHNVRMAFMVGKGLETNKTYKLKGYTTVDPLNQMVTHVFTDAVQTDSDIEAFIHRGKYRDLREYTIDRPTVDKIHARLEKIYEFYARNVTRIRHRFDLHLLLDLTFRSVLGFTFGNEVVKRGWMDVIVIGDTRVGKGDVSSGLMKWFGVGESISGENCSFVGLVAGLEQYGKNWVVSWGKFPMNDCGLLIIDEAERLREIWELLSRLRSEGVVEVTKIHKQKTQARVRLISLCNPPLRSVANYSYGVQALRDVVKADEDIARFDAALVLAHNEVGIEEINKPVSQMHPLYSRELEHRLVMWSWSRRPDQVAFSPEAVTELYRASVMLGKMYDFSIPLIQGEDIRVKLARVAAAVAARFFSHKRDGEILSVEKVHVEYAYVFFNLMYQKEASGYYVYSQMRRPQYAVEESMKEIDNYFGVYRNHQHVYKVLLMSQHLVPNDLVEVLCQPREVVHEAISMLLKYDCIEKRGPTYVKRPIFSTWLRKKVSHRHDVDKEGT